MKTLTFEVEDDFSERLDVYLADLMESASRNKIKNWCKDGLIRVNGLARKGSFTVNGGQLIEVSVPEETAPDKIKPEDLPLDIVFEDPHIAVINKEAGIVVHPGAGVYSGTLVNALAFHFKQLSQTGGGLRPGIVHRLDKGTSGLILVAKTDEAHRNLNRQWQNGSVTKVYQALVWGLIQPPEGEITTNMGRHPRYRQIMAAEVPGGRFAHTRYKTTETYPEASRVNVHILTGRTHQIRVHLAFLGHPVVGDSMYGKNRHKNLAKSFTAMPDHPMLHAALLRFNHPQTNQTLTFKQDPPSEFFRCADALAQWPY